MRPSCSKDSKEDNRVANKEVSQDSSTLTTTTTVPSHTTLNSNLNPTPNSTASQTVCTNSKQATNPTTPHLQTSQHNKATNLTTSLPRKPMPATRDKHSQRTARLMNLCRLVRKVTRKLQQAIKKLSTDPTFHNITSAYHNITIYRSRKNTINHYYNTPRPLFYSSFPPHKDYLIDLLLCLS